MAASIHSKVWSTVEGVHVGVGRNMPPGVDYLPVNSADHMQQIAIEMIAYAKANPFDYKQALKDAKEQGNAEYHEGFMRLKSVGGMDNCKPYTRLIKVGMYHLQVCYYEMDVDELGLIGQFTLTDSFQTLLEYSLSGSIMSFFLDMKRLDDIKITKTPPHVVLACQKVVNEKSGS